MLSYLYKFCSENNIKKLNLKIKNLKNYDGKKPFIVDSLQPKKNGIKLRFTKSSLLRFVKQNKVLMVSKL